LKTPKDSDCYYFVDETGDPTFYDGRGNLLLGTPGVSPILALGFIQTERPRMLRQALAGLHAEVQADAYLQSFPSAARTKRAFHAKDDRPEVRHLVFNLLRTLEFKAQVVVARKIERVFRNNFEARAGAFYDHLVTTLFTNVLHRFQRNHIYFAKRGSSDRQQPLLSALQEGIRQFETRWNTEVQTETRAQAQVPSDEPGLQIVDYVNWAVYQAFVRREMRYFKLIEDKFSLVVDLYDHERYPHNWYNRGNPFDIEKASPL
jgi:hypothetical protein